jgi:hypothetical protein
MDAADTQPRQYVGRLVRVKDVSERDGHLRTGFAAAHDEQLPPLSSQTTHRFGDDLGIRLDRAVFVRLEKLAGHSNLRQLRELPLEVRPCLVTIGLVEPSRCKHDGQP